MIEKINYFEELENLLELKQETVVREARTSFWDYARLKAPDFYKRDRFYLKRICNELESFYNSDEKVMILNMPPRHGKSRSAGLFIEWLLGQNNKLKVMTGSYNETLSTTFSKGVRNSIMEAKADKTQVVYSDIFPDTMIKYGDGASNLWGLVGGHYNYLATSPTGTATGFGANILIIDDLIKNAEEAFNDNVLEKHWDWFTQTMLSRLEENGKIIIVMTRWSTNDLAGKVKKHYKELGESIREVKMKALQDDGTMLSEEVLSYKSYKSKIISMGEEIASANYQQEPINIKGKLYSKFKTYEKVVDFKRIINYTDTADEGKDYLCSITAGETFTGDLYLLDVIYTKAGMEITEPETARGLLKNKVNLSYIESNSGGRGFARAVQRIMWEEYKNKKTTIKWFHQSKNKQARILSNSVFVMENVYFPENWMHKWEDFYIALNTYQKEGKNKHDDAPDAITGLCEIIMNDIKDNTDEEQYKVLKSLGL